MLTPKLRANSEGASGGDPRQRTVRPFVTLAAIVFASLFAYSVTRAPLPNVNEPHYLCKAKHYWNPDWCRGDLFLESSNPHQFFYHVVGWPTLWLSLESTAWLGRIVALGLLAVGWTAFVMRLRLGCWAPVWSLWLYMLIVALGNLSGEWIIGGVESKVFAYALVLLAGAFALDRAWNRAAVAAGLAIAFHPLVGVWAVAATILSVILARRTWTRATTAHARSLVQHAWLPVTLLLICGLPGLLPALSAVGESSLAADRIQVFERLAHHLDPMAFPWRDYLWAGLLLLCWLACREWRTENAALGAFERFALACLVIAVAGFLVGFGPRPPEQMPLYELRTKILKFYAFRLCDAVLPILVATLVVARAQALSRRPLWKFGPGAVTWIIAAGALLASLIMPAVDRNPSRMPPDRLSDWIAACSWIDAQAPRDALFVTPRASWGFKWYASRAEFYSYKDCPQDAASILEWRRRGDWLKTWRYSLRRRAYTAADIETLRNETSATHLLARRGRRFQIAPIYRNASFAVYRLR